MKKRLKKTSVLAISLFLLCSLLVLPGQVKAAGTSTYYPTEKTTGLVKNPAMGWVLYCDAFGQMTDSSIPDYNKCVNNPSLFWQTFDNSGATEKANIFYLRAPWSFFESAEGQYAWNHDPNYQALVQGALDRGLKLAFRVYVDSQDSWQQATPQYVRSAGAKGYTNTFWTPYVNDAVFLNKFTHFISVLGLQYNDPSKVDFIDGMGLGSWGEGHNIKTDILQPGNVKTSVARVTEAYEAAFDRVLLGAQQGGSLAETSEVLVELNKYDVLRRDSLGMPKYFKPADVTYYVNQLLGYGIPLFAENGWNYFAHDFTGYMNRNGNPYSNIRDMLTASLNDAKAARANTFDLRVPEDAIEWMNNVDLVDDFIVNGGYRLVPVSLNIPVSVTNQDYVTVSSIWKNTGLGKLPNNRPGWNYKYKLAFALLDPATSQPVLTHITNIDPSEWMKGNTYSYESHISFGNIPAGMYDFAYAIVDTTNGNTPAINLAITDPKTAGGWYKTDQISVSGLDNTAPLPKLPSYRFAEDFSSTQGQKQWYYMQGSGTSYSNMSWDQANSRWQGTQAYSILRGNAFFHPDNNDTVLAWKAPAAGNITINGNPRKQNGSCGDGVQVKIMKNTNQLWPVSGWHTIGSADQVGITHQLATTVAQNDMIYFVVNKNGNNSCDGTIWNPVIDYGRGIAPVNIAPQAVVSTTMGTSAGSISNINNEVMTDAWSSANAVTFPGYITLESGVAVQTNRITLASHYGQGQGITNLDVEYFEGSAWVPAVSHVPIVWNSNSSAVEYRDITFPAVNTSKIRLKVNSGNLTWNHVALNELQWWANE